MGRWEGLYAGAPQPVCPVVLEGRARGAMRGSRPQCGRHGRHRPCARKARAGQGPGAGCELGSRPRDPPGNGRRGGSSLGRSRDRPRADAGRVPAEGTVQIAAPFQQARTGSRQWWAEQYRLRSSLRSCRLCSMPSVQAPARWARSSPEHLPGLKMPVLLIWTLGQVVPVSRQRMLWTTSRTAVSP